MKTDITKYFDATGKSLNGKIQLAQNEAHHNCAANTAEYAYEQATAIEVRDNGVDPVEIVKDGDNVIHLITVWDITNPDAENEDEACDWSDFSVFAEAQGYDLEAIITQ